MSDRVQKEFETRLQKIREAMAKRHISHLFVPISVNQRYMCGLNLIKRERLTAAIVPRKGDVTIVCPYFELERIKQQFRLSDGEVVGWKEHEDPYTYVSKTIGDGDKNVAVEPTAWFSEYSKLAKALPSAAFVNAGPLFTELRSIKSEWEKDNIRRAIEIIREARRAMFTQLRKGITETEACEILRTEGAKRGGENPHPHGVHLGINTSYPHGGNEDVHLTEGTVILVDAGVFCQGYRSDISRTTTFGRPPSRFSEIFEIVREAQQTAIAHIGPGMLPEELDRIAHAFIDKSGYGEYFPHRLGHGLGMEVHEPPYIAPGQTVPLQVGNVFTVEPGIYLPGHFGIRIEDNVIVTGDGCEVLSQPVDTFEPIKHEQGG